MYRLWQFIIYSRKTKQFITITYVYLENNELSINQSCIGYTIFGDKPASLLVVFFTDFALAKYSTTL